jgi:hypothetical protein
MIRNFIFFLLFSTTLFGTNILSYNIYDRSDRVDIMLTFDTPYEGKIVKSSHASKIVLKLYGVKIESTKIKTVNSKFLQTLTISPMAQYTQIVAKLPSNNIVLKASKTRDAYGLRLRFYIPQATTNETAVNASTPNLSALPTKSTTDISTSYYIVVTLLIVGIIILLLLKKKIANSPQNTKQNTPSWLFKNQFMKTTPQEQQAPSASKNADMVTIRFQKPLNEKNSVVMFDCLNQSYLLLLGEHNNILLDKFTDNIPTTQSEFDSILQEKHTELEEYLKVEQKPTENKETKEDQLRFFSNKASNIPYEL